MKNSQTGLWGRVNDDQTPIFGWTTPLRLSKTNPCLIQAQSQTLSNSFECTNQIIWLLHERFYLHFNSFKLRSWKHAISFRCIGSCIPRVAQSRNALLGRNASCRNNCPHPSLGTQLKEIQMVCNLSSPPLLLWRKARGGQGVFDLGQWRVGHLHTRKHTNLLLLNHTHMIKIWLKMSEM